MRTPTRRGTSAETQATTRLSTSEERFERWRRSVGLWAGPLGFLLLWVLPVPGLQEPAHRLLAVMGLVVVWWVTEAVPLAVTALLGPALCVVCGIAPARETLRPFADPVIFLFLGGFFLAEAMMKHGLNRRIAFAVLALPGVGSSPLGLFAGFGVLTAGVSMWVSNTATAAMVLPIALAVLRELSARQPTDGTGPPDWRRLACAPGLILVVAFSASIGGLATPIGTPPNLIGLGLIERALDRRIAFFEWMHFGLPLAVGLTALLVWRLHRTSPVGPRWSPEATSWIRTQAEPLGRWSPPQQRVALVFAGAVSLWCLPGVIALLAGREAPLVAWWHTHLPEGVVAILALGALFVVPTGLGASGRLLEWGDAPRVDWGTILLFGGGMALGELAFSSGLARWAGEGAAGWLPWKSPLSLAALFAVTGVCVSEATSNTASANMVVPLAIGVAQAAGVDPLQPALAACLGCSLGFMLPVSTPPNALAYGTGAVPLTHMIRQGCWLDAVGCAGVVAVVALIR